MTDWLFFSAAGVLSTAAGAVAAVLFLKSRQSAILKRTEESLKHTQKLLAQTQRQIDLLLYALEDLPGLSREDLKKLVRKAHQLRPPRLIPPGLLSRYTMDGHVAVREKYRGSVYAQKKQLFYDRRQIEAHMDRIRKGDKSYPRYGPTNDWLLTALQKYSIQGKEVVIMGSNKPWYESVCLYHKGKCTTIEYNRIATDHPDLRILTPEEYDLRPSVFDAAMAISSFEHDGLGRYGDPLNPDGDLDAMKKMKSVLRPNGLLFLSVPVGRDTLVWNLHRVYGKLRLPLLLEGWKVLERYGFEEAGLEREENNWEPLFILQNTAS